MTQIETFIRQAIRDSVNQSSRKPFSWGGLSGYEQLQAIAQGLDQIQDTNPYNDYLRLLRSRLESVLTKNQTVAEDLRKAHDILHQVANCLQYPPSSPSEAQFPITRQISAQQVAQEMTKLIQEIRPDGKVQRAQIRLQGALKRRWELFGQELLFTYDIPGLPQDNLKLEGLFGRLRRHQRRISGRKSTRELLDFGQAQVLFTATNIQELLDQIQLVSLETYHKHRIRLAAAELPRQFFHRLHHDPLKTIHALVSRHLLRSQSLIQCEAPAQPEQALHT